VGGRPLKTPPVKAAQARKSRFLLAHDFSRKPVPILDHVDDKLFAIMG
jgi:hypothetical protein